MPLSIAVYKLEEDIAAAFINKKQAMESLKKNDDEARARIEEKFYKELAQAIHNYTLSAQVSTGVTTAVTGVAGPLAPTGATGVVGAGVGSGTGNLL